MGGSGRVAALEILVATPAIRNLIRDDKIHQIYGTMQAGQERLGMQTMNQSLARLVERRLISRDTAYATSSLRDELVTLLERGTSAAHPAAMPAGQRRTPAGQPVGPGVGR
jgi:twitching motility protein PilT